MTNTPNMMAKLAGSTAERKMNFEDGMRALYEAKDALAAASDAFLNLDSDDPAHWLGDDCYNRWLLLRRLLTKIEDGEV